jgi:hypothetical protein
MNLDTEGLRNYQTKSRSVSKVKDQKHSDGDNGGRKRPVSIVSIKSEQVLKVFSSKNEAYDFIGPLVSDISRFQVLRYIRSCLAGRQKSFLGLLFRYAADDDHSASLNLNLDGVKEHQQFGKRASVGDNPDSDNRPTKSSIKGQPYNGGIALVDMRSLEVLRVFDSKSEGFETLRPLLPSRTTRTMASCYIRACIHGRQRSYGGFLWRKATEEDIASSLRLDIEGLREHQSERIHSVACISKSDQSVLKVFHSLREAVRTLRSILTVPVNIGVLKRRTLKGASYVGFNWKVVDDSEVGSLQYVATVELLKHYVPEPVRHRSTAPKRAAAAVPAAANPSSLSSAAGLVGTGAGSVGTNAPQIPDLSTGFPPNFSLECFSVDTNKIVRVFHNFDSVLDFLHVMTGGDNDAFITKIQHSIVSGSQAFGVGWRYRNRDSFNDDTNLAIVAAAAADDMYSSSVSAVDGYSVGDLHLAKRQRVQPV